MKKLWRIFLDIVSDNREPDAKRVGGFLGWIVCIIIALCSIFIEIKSPDIADTLFWTSCILLGIDGITSVLISRGKNK